MDHSMEGYLSIGQVLRPQGLKGLVKIRPDTDDPGRFSRLDQLFIQSNNGLAAMIEFSNVSVRGSFVYMNLGEDDTVEKAVLRRGQKLFIPRDQAVPLNENENFISDLLGCKLIDTNGNLIGTLTDVLQPGANDVYTVSTPQGTLLVPALRHVILDVDIKQKLITAQADRLWEVSIFEG